MQTRPSSRVFVASISCTVLLGFAASLRAAAAGGISFNREIRPILAENCMSCHGPDNNARKADLRLDTEAGLFEPRKDSPAPVVRGSPEKSELFKRLLSKDKDEVMPPPDSHKELKPAEIALLRRWIEEGAPWQKHWAFIPPEKGALPPVRNEAWPKNPVDRFVLAKLEASGLSPAQEAPPRVFFRRLHLDVTGLPPKIADVEAFASDYTALGEAAVGVWMERLMHLPAWGEHRARYWLDAARYGDTHGLHFDNYREMWPYRDWVIRAFNSDKRFSEFTLEQVAGDLLPQPREDQLIATGFQRCNITTAEGGTIAEENLANYAADRVQTMGWVYLGLTLNCSQCHDHKFDPISMRDYYAMAAFFRNTTQGASDGNSKDGRSAVLVVPKEEDRPRWTQLPALIEESRSRRNARREAVRPEFQKWIQATSAEVFRTSFLSSGLKVWVPLDEGGGETGRVHGAQAGAFEAVPGLEWAPGGKLGAAPVFKKGGPVVLGDVGGFEAGQAFSFGAWVKPLKVDASGGILGRFESKPVLRGYDLFQSGRSYSVHLANKWPENGLKVVTPPVVKAGVWQHVFVSYDGSGKPAGLRIFVDGKEEKLKVENSTLKPGSDIRVGTGFTVGQRSGGAAFEGGSVQDVRIYDRALGASEVKQLLEYPALVAALAVSPEKRTPNQKNALLDYYLVAHDAAYQEADKQLATLESEKSAIAARSPITHIQEEVKGRPAMANILMRGQYNRVGEEVVAHPPMALHALPEGAPANRLGLAQWLVDKANPLTPRVTVNRFWQEVFGQGIVRTADDFGLMGAAPSNVELLDWLAADFRDNGGDIRRLFRLMLGSAAYRQSAVVSPEKLEKDPENALLSRGPRFRMDGEMVRDYALSVSALLSPRMYGPSVKPYQPENIWDVVGLPGGDTRNYVQDKGENLYRRTLYSFWKRMAPPPNMEIFNAPAREASCVRRERTNTPLQALVTLNDPQFVEAARKLAEQALLAAGEDKTKAVDYIVQRVLGRSATEKERAVLVSSEESFLTHYQRQPGDAAELLKVGDSPVLANVAQPALAAWTMVCNQVLNLDETLNK